jgi:hypothetical protein
VIKFIVTDAQIRELIKNVRKDEATTPDVLAFLQLYQVQVTDVLTACLTEFIRRKLA